MLRSFLILIPLLLLVASCSSERIKIARSTDGPKQLFVIIQNDSELIALDVKQNLQNLGYKVVLSSEEGSRDIVRKSKDGKEILKNVSFSQNRYELVFNYKLSQERFVFMSATLRDRQENELLGTYKWEWNRLFPAPTIDSGINILNEKLLVKIFNK